MSEEDFKFKSSSQILNLPPVPHDPVRETHIKGYLLFFFAQTHYQIISVLHQKLLPSRIHHQTTCKFLIFSFFRSFFWFLMIFLFLFSNKFEDQSKQHKLEDAGSKTPNPERFLFISDDFLKFLFCCRNLLKRQGLTPPKTSEETLSQITK